MNKKIKAVTFFGIILVQMGVFQVLNAQSPLVGIQIEEQVLDLVSEAKIVSQLSLNDSLQLRCWRVYACLDDRYWEMQAMYGDTTSPWVLETTSSIWQSPTGGALSSNNNPAFYDITPEAAYDSWFAIGGEDKSNMVQALDGPLRPLKQFEMGGGFVENSLVGTSILGVWIAPNTQGRPDSKKRLLIAQFTTTGSIAATMNFQFRKLNKDDTVQKPTHVEKATQVQFTIDGSGPSEQYFEINRP